jgi:hypothetical protein
VKTRLSILAVLSAQILACQGPESALALGLCSKESTAISAASDLLAKQRFSNEYVVGRAHGLDSGDKWKIWIPRATAEGTIVMPANGLVEVAKADCTSRWVPQR